jgi:hypothetical protein
MEIRKKNKYFWFFICYFVMCSESSNIGLVGLKSKSTGKRPSQYCLIHYTQLQLSIVNQAILAWSALSICLQLYIVNQAILAWSF